MIGAMASAKVGGGSRLKAQPTTTVKKKTAAKLRPTMITGADSIREATGHQICRGNNLKNGTSIPCVSFHEVIWSAQLATDISKTGGIHMNRLAVFLCFFVTIPALAQVNATVTGTAADATGALVPGVSITAQNNATGIVTSRVTNESGNYNFPSLQP